MDAKGNSQVSCLQSSISSDGNLNWFTISIDNVAMYLFTFFIGNLFIYFILLLR